MLSPRLCLALTIAASVSAAPHKHLFSDTGALTAESSAPPRKIADDFLRSQAAALGLSGEDLAGAYIVKEYRTSHNGVSHFVYGQRFHGLPVFNAEWTVNIDREGRVINAGGFLSAAPGAGLAPASASSARSATRAAAIHVNPRLGEKYPAWQKEAGERRHTFESGGFGEPLESEAAWFSLDGQLRPAWVVFVLDEDRMSRWAVVVDSLSSKVLAKESLTWFQSPPQGLVFERRSPQPNPNPGTRLTSPPPLVDRTMQSFAGDRLASPLGWVAATETAGNNTITGTNHLGIPFAPPLTAAALNRIFSFPLVLGPGAPSPLRFPEASTVNLFYWTNRAHDLFYEAGFDEAAGNYQRENLERGGAGGDPMLAYAQYAAAGSPGAGFLNAFYTTRRSGQDGTASGIHMFLGAGGPDRVFTESAYDTGVIVHEYTHGVSTRLVRQLSGFHGGALGEAWSDFFSFEFITPDGAPPDGIYPEGEYFIQAYNVGIRSRPYSTSMDVNPLTFASFGRALSSPAIHNDGGIWVESLLEVRANLIAQFGEREGRRRTRLLVIDGMKLSPPAPTFVDARDAILLADRVGFGGASQNQIWAGFAKRGLGVLAHADSTGTINVVASFETPSNTGVVRFYQGLYVIGEPVRVLLHDANNPSPAVRVQLTASSGDLEDLLLRRSGSLFLGTINSASAAVTPQDGLLALIPGDAISVYYVDQDAGGSPRLIDTTVGTRVSYFQTTSPADFRFGTEQPLNFRAPVGVFARVNLPIEFPFFDKRYSSALIYSNGLIAFDLPVTSACTDRSALANVTGIAPMWMDLRTDGSVQPNENVYTSRNSSDSVTFRWAGESDVVPQVVNRPEPLNFAATLYDDGRIVFHYGAGNRNLATGAPFAGCPTSTPTVGISKGNSAFTQIVGTHSNQGALENAPTVSFEPPFPATNPEVVLESPAAEETFQGILKVAGIAYDSEMPVRQIDIFIDGVARARTFVNTSRPDFCASRNVRGCPAVGFTGNFSAAGLGLTAGPHTLMLRAINARGGLTDLRPPVRFHIESGQGRLPRGRLESPVEGQAVSGTVPVRGWALADDLRLLRVEILVDGITFGNAALNDLRTDVCTGSTSPNCPRAGFTFMLNTATGLIPVPNGRHTLEVRAVDETGRFTLIPEQPVNIEVGNTSNAPPVGILEAPLANSRLSGRVTIRGWAYDPDGRVLSATLLVDGVARAAALYGRPRPDVCQGLAGVAACPNIGFEVEFDTRFLGNGLHNLGVRLIDDRGSAVTIPDRTAFGMNVFVEN